VRFVVRGLNPAACYRHFVFDLDGTLVDSGADLASAVNETLRGLGLPELPETQVVDFVGHGMRRLLQSSLAATAPGRVSELIGPAIDLFREAYAQGLLDRTRLHDGIMPLLSELRRRGACLSLLTNKPRAFTEAILCGLEVEACFSDMVCGDDVAAPKPDPQGLQALVERSGVPAGLTCLVGDSAVDVETARAAGIASCAVTWGLRRAGELRASRPDHLVDDAARIADLPVVVREGGASGGAPPVPAPAT
jgi:phosphoglycolate phosphatase